MTIAQDIQIAKQSLRQALADHAGNTKHPAVIETIQALAQLNPTPAPARNLDLQAGHWTLINAPNFPGGDRQPNGQYHYTLGRLAFNMFQPTTLTVRIDRVFQPILSLDNDQPDNDQPDNSQQTHDIWTEFTIVEDSCPKLSGMVQNLGVCQPHDDERLQVQFTGGCLKPLASTDLALWKQVFANQAKGQPQQKVAQTSMKERLSNLFLRWMFGLVPPEGMDAKTGEVMFTMQRSPKGKLQILYLDEEMRITKGEKGTVLVCDRLRES